MFIFMNVNVEAFSINGMPTGFSQKKKKKTHLIKTVGLRMAVALFLIQLSIIDLESLLICKIKAIQFFFSGLCESKSNRACCECSVRRDRVTCKCYSMFSYILFLILRNISADLQ